MEAERDRIQAELIAAKTVAAELKTKYSEQAAETQKAMQNVTQLNDKLTKAENDLKEIATAFQSLTGN